MTSQFDSSVSAETIAQSFVFIDATVEDRRTLINSVAPGTAVMVLDADRDGVDQITAALASVSGIASIHIVSHGAPGCLYLGNTELSLSTLAQYAPQIEAWNGAIADDASILLYGCNVAAGDAGAEFVTAFHRLTHAHIGASQTLTGNAAKGGNWDLEVTTGAIAPLAFDVAALATYEGILPGATLGDATWDVLDDGEVDTGDIGVSSEGAVIGLDSLSFTINDAPIDPFPFDNAQTGATITGTRTYTDGALAGLTAVLEHRVVAGINGEPVLRTFITLTNGGTAAVTPSVGLLADIAGGNLNVITTSSGDTTFDSSDRFVLTEALEDEGKTVGVNTFAFFGTPSAAALENIGIGQTLAQGLSADYNSVEVAPGASRSFLFFNSISTDATEATTEAAQFQNFNSLASNGLLTGLTNAQLKQVQGLGATGGIEITPLNGTTTEAGGTATFSVRLTGAAPDSDVTVSFASSDTTEGTVTPSLTFTAANFSTPQTITVTGVDDTAVDGNINYTVTATVNASASSIFSGVAPVVLSLSNTDNDRAPAPTPTPTPTPTPGIGRTIVGTARKDTLTGTEFNDVIRGKGENDTLFGNGGNDSMNGGVGNDKLFGGAGNDTLNGGRGKDKLFGGDGNDVFVIAARSGPDVIRDYQDGVDKIDLTGGLTFGSLTLTQSGNNTVIRSGSEVLATLRGVASSTLSSADFV